MKKLLAVLACAAMSLASVANADPAKSGTCQAAAAQFSAAIDKASGAAGIKKVLTDAGMEAAEAAALAKQGKDAAKKAVNGNCAG